MLNCTLKKTLGTLENKSTRVNPGILIIVSLHVFINNFTSKLISRRETEKESVDLEGGWLCIEDSEYRT